MPVQVIGLKEANKALRRLPEPHVKGEVQQTIDVTAYAVSRVAASTAPRSRDGSHGRPPGFMARSISWARRPRSLTAVVTVAREAFYWRFVEYGTKRFSARPFLRPAADGVRLDHKQRLVAALTRASTKMAKEGYRG